MEEHIEETVLLFERDSVAMPGGANGRLERRVIDRKVKKGTEQAIQQYTESSDSVASFHRAAAKSETVAKKGNHTEVSKWILVLLLFFSLYLLLITKKRLR